MATKELVVKAMWDLLQKLPANKSLLCNVLMASGLAAGIGFTVSKLFDRRCASLQWIEDCFTAGWNKIKDYAEKIIEALQSLIKLVSCIFGLRPIPKEGISFSHENIFAMREVIAIMN